MIGLPPKYPPLESISSRPPILPLPITVNWTPMSRKRCNHQWGVYLSMPATFWCLAIQILRHAKVLLPLSPSFYVSIILCKGLGLGYRRVFQGKNWGTGLSFPCYLLGRYCLWSSSSFPQVTIRKPNSGNRGRFEVKYVILSTLPILCLGPGLGLG